MKQISRFCLLALSLLLGSACESDSQSNVDLYSAVPQNSAVIVESHQLLESIERFGSSRIFAETDSLPLMADLNSRLKTLISGFDKDSLRDFFDDRKIIMATARSGADKFDALYLTTADRDFEKSLGRKLNKQFSATKKSYSGADIYYFVQEQGGNAYYLCSYRGVLMLSANAQLVEEGVRQLNSDFSLRQEPGFARLLKTANHRDMANLYLNLDELGPLINKLLPQAEIDFLARMGSWAEMDLQTHDQELLLSGLTLLNDGKARYLSTFKGLKPQKLQAADIVPTGTALWLSLAFSNAERYYRNYEEYLEEAGRLRRHQQILAKQDYNLRSGLLEWVDNEMGLFGNAGKGGNVNYLAYFAYRDEELARGKLDSLASADFIEGYRGVIVKKMAAENALPRLYGPLFQSFHFPYYFVQNGYVVFAENLPVLKGVINDLLDGKTLAEDESYRQFVAKIPDRSHLRVIAANPAFIPLLANITSAEDAAVLEQQQAQLHKLRWGALQLEVEEEEAALTNFYLRHEARQKEMVSRLWSTQLQSEAANIPQFLKNHVNNRYDIAVQDEDNRLYLLDYNGKILWTKMLDGPIMGNITQVDAFKNRKLQMVFNTPNKLYLVDRLGRDVENFPVALTETATAPVGVFNYDFARNYRLVVPAGKNLLNYGIEGREVQGWNFKSAGSEIITQPQHFSVARQDVIVVETADGRLLQLNRRGEQRFETINDLPRLDIPFYLKEAESLATSEMISTGEEGQLYAFHPGGSVDKLYLEPGHPAEYFIFFDGKYIFSSGEKLFVKSDKSPWQAELEGDISSKPKAMILRGKFYTAAFSKEAEEIRLYNEKGELIEGFPVFAQGPFDMGSLKLDGSINVVTYSKDGTLICYRVE